MHDEVRLNEEVKAVVEVTAARAIEKGEPVTEDDIAGYKDILLTEDDPNAGHITIVTHKGGWAVVFDFRRNAALIAEHVELARQFLEAAAWAHEKGYSRVIVYILFSATELMAKGMLIWQPDRSLLDSKTHRSDQDALQPGAEARQRRPAVRRPPQAALEDPRTREIPSR